MNLHEKAGGGPGIAPGKYLFRVADIEEGLESRNGDAMVKYDIQLLDIDTHDEVGSKPYWALMNPNAKGFFGFANLAVAVDPKGAEDVAETEAAIKKYARTLVGKYGIAVIGAKPYKDRDTGEERNGTEFVRMLALQEGYKTPGAPVSSKKATDDDIPF